jgi:hypothetical protein
LAIRSCWLILLLTSTVLFLCVWIFFSLLYSCCFSSCSFYEFSPQRSVKISENCTFVYFSPQLVSFSLMHFKAFQIMNMQLALSELLNQCLNPSVMIFFTAGFLFGIFTKLLCYFLYSYSIIPLIYV